MNAFVVIGLLKRRAELADRKPTKIGPRNSQGVQRLAIDSEKSPYGWY
jgi:hypothetical protein